MAALVELLIFRPNGSGWRVEYVCVVKNDALPRAAFRMHENQRSSALRCCELQRIVKNGPDAVKWLHFLAVTAAMG